MTMFSWGKHSSFLEPQLAVHTLTKQREAPSHRGQGSTAKPGLLPQVGIGALWSQMA